MGQRESSVLAETALKYFVLIHGPFTCQSINHGCKCLVYLLLNRFIFCKTCKAFISFELLFACYEQEKIV